MSELVKELVEILPESDLYRTVIIMLGIIIIPVKPAIWIGKGIRYSVRWIRCQIFSSHSWITVSGALNLWGQPMSGMIQCRVCLRQQYF